MKSALFDTSFFIRLLNDSDPLQQKAKDYLKYFLSNNIVCKISTIAIAEYGVGEDVRLLPWSLLKVVPFQLNHALVAGFLMHHVYEEKQKRGARFPMRSIVPNDTKMFAQAHYEFDIDYFVSSDSEAKKVFDMLPQHNFQFVDISKSFLENGIS